jgi:hypothetical protein
MEFKQFTRTLLRSEEIATEQKAKSSVVTVYGAVLAPVAHPYLAADAAVATAQAFLEAKSQGAFAALAALAQPYAEARDVAAALVDGVALPATLPSQPTDTDQIKGVLDLLTLLNTHQSEPWAKDLLAGPLGQNGAITVQNVKACIDAAKDLDKSRKDRQAAYPAAWEAFLKFKKVVCSAYGRTSRQYQRINPRADAPKKKDGTPTAEKKAPPATTAPAPAATAPAPAATAPAPATPVPPALSAATTAPATPDKPAAPATPPAPAALTPDPASG